MRFAHLASLSFASLASLALLSGCTADASTDDDAASAEPELQTACALGAGCPDAIKLLSAATFDPVPRVAARDDVTVPFQGNPEWIAEPFATTTSRKLTFAGSARVMLTGSADGAAPIVIDDFVLVEVLAESGQVLSRGIINPSAGTLVDGVAPTTLAAPSRGADRSTAGATRPSTSRASCPPTRRPSACA